jgi:hypothetical protein
MEGIRGKDAIIENASAAIPATVGMPLITALAPDHLATALTPATVDMPLITAPAAATLTLGICRAGRKR